MFGGRQFLFGLILGGLSYAFFQTKDGRRLVSQTAKALSNLGQDTVTHEVHDDSRKSDDDSRESGMRGA